MVDPYDISQAEHDHLEARAEDIQEGMNRLLRGIFNEDSFRVTGAGVFYRREDIIEAFKKLRLLDVDPWEIYKEKHKKV